MRLGLLADIHEAVEPLREALALFAQHGVDRVVHLGDVCRDHKRLGETVDLLRQGHVAGVWGNHDFGLCQPADEEMRRRYSPDVLDYMATLTGRLSLDDCLFSHVEPWLDPNDVLQLWYFEDRPTTAEQLARCFNASAQRVLFSGHRHEWFLAAPDGPTAWDGRSPIRLAPPGRYLVVLHAVMRGRCAVYDTATGDLVPLRLAGAEG
jgi:hypothetical protein